MDIQAFAWFVKNEVDMVNAIEHCRHQNQLMPSLVLLFSLIDNMAWVASDDEARESNRRNFESWVKAWMLPHLAESAPKIDATDLYAARCASLHTLTGTSALFRAGKAKRICYSWGQSQSSELDEFLGQLGVSESHVALRFDDLFRALRKAIEAFLSSADHDKALYARISEATRHHYGLITPEANEK